MVDFHDNDGRRYGDWQKKDLRKDANEIVGVDDVDEPWYKRTFGLVVLILAFWPVGLVLCWKGKWPLVAKIVATLYVIASAAGMMWVYTSKM